MGTSERELDTCPAFGICGYSGSGKTTLIAALVSRLRGRGLKVGVIKQDAHGLDIDREGKDTDRLFKAGADVLIRDAEQVFVRLHRNGDLTLRDLLRLLAPHYDLILVEGHKGTPLPFKVWLSGSGNDEPPREAVGIRRVLSWSEDREAATLELLDDWLSDMWRSARVHAGILIGGNSTRMGRPKHLIETHGESWLERAVTAVRGQVDRTVLLGRGELPTGFGGLLALPDAEDADGPLRGMRSAMRWAPGVSWLFVACDLPHVAPAAVAWLMEQRRTGVRAIMPLVPGQSEPEPLLAFYDWRMAPELERVRRPRDLAAVPGVVTPVVPAELACAWRNVNTPADLIACAGEGGPP